METLAQIQAHIKREARHGDYSTVAGLAGLKADTVRRIINGSRNNPVVVRLFADYLDKRGQLEKQLKGEIKL